jgi:AcrR family transcriptional regulator
VAGLAGTTGRAMLAPRLPFRMNNTRERILTSGLDLLTQNGFAGVTLGVLAQQTGISKSGLFAHFGSKEAVQLSLLETMARVGASTFVEPGMRSPPGLPRLQAVFTGWLGWTERAGLHGGCPVAAGMFELDDVDPADPVRQRLLRMEEDWRRFLIQLASEAAETGDLRADLDVEQFVWELCAIYLNHHVSYRFVRDPRATQRALTAFRTLVQSSGRRQTPSHRRRPRTTRGRPIKPFSSKP